MASTTKKGHRLIHMKHHIIQGYIQHIHLIEYEHGCLMLDGGCRADLATIQDFFMTILKRPVTDLKVVMVTHLHPDHAGCVAALKQLTQCTVVTGTYTAPWYAGWKGRLAHLVDMGLAIWVAGRMGKKRQNIWYSPILREDHQLQDGDVVPGFEDWHIINTPGHTDRDISLVNPTEKLIYVADLIVSVKQQLCAPILVYFPKQYKASLARLKHYVGYMLLMAHVKPQTLHEAQIDSLINHAPSSPKTNMTTMTRLIKGKLAQYLK